MIVTVKKGTAKGRIVAPPSKSMAHRNLICGALSSGSVIGNLQPSEDIKATLSCLKKLGASLSLDEKGIKIGGLNPSSVKKPLTLFCNESGSTLRFLIPLCLISEAEITLKGTKRLFERPLGIYEDICRLQGLKFETAEDSVTLKGPIKSGVYSIRGDVSSQFITGLLLALPLLEGESRLDVSSSLESASYINLTLQVLADFGIRVTRKDENTFLIPGGQKYRAFEGNVEGDYSNAAFFEALNIAGGNVAVKGLREDSLQGDSVYKKLFVELKGKKAEVDISDCPDLGPILMAVAAMLDGATFTGTRRLKIKESDRAEAMRAELSKFGITVEVEENRVTVKKGELKTPTEPLDSHNDHRIAMSLAVLCTLTGGTIKGAEAVAKSFPSFYDKLRELEIEVEGK